MLNSKYPINQNARIGLDKVTLSNITIKHFHMDRFLEKCNTEKNITYYPDPTLALGFSFLKISDKEFPFQEFSITYHAKSHTYRVIIQICVNADLIEGNLDNWLIEDLLFHIDHYIIPELSQYGFEVSFDHATFSTMEINYTFILPDSYDAMFPVITRILWNCNGFQHSKFYCSDNYQLIKNKYNLYDEKLFQSTYILPRNSKSQKQIIAYDKSTEMKKNKNMETDTPILRLELKLKSAYRIKLLFHKNELYKISNSDIQNIFCKFVISPVYDYIVNKYPHEEYNKSKELYKLHSNEYNNIFNKIVKDIDSKTFNKRSPYILTDRGFLAILQNSKEFIKNGNKQKKIASLKKAFSNSNTIKPEYSNYLDFFQYEFKSLLENPSKNDISQITFRY